MTESNKLIVATAVIFVSSRLSITVSRAEGAHIALFEMAPSASLPYIVLHALQKHVGCLNPVGLPQLQF